MMINRSVFGDQTATNPDQDEDRLSVTFREMARALWAEVESWLGGVWNGQEAKEAAPLALAMQRLELQT